MESVTRVLRRPVESASPKRTFPRITRPSRCRSRAGARGGPPEFLTGVRSALSPNGLPAIGNMVPAVCVAPSTHKGNRSAMAGKRYPLSRAVISLWRLRNPPQALDVKHCLRATPCLSPRRGVVLIRPAQGDSMMPGSREPATGFQRRTIQTKDFNICRASSW